MTLLFWFHLVDLVRLLMFDCIFDNAFSCICFATPPFSVSEKMYFLSLLSSLSISMSSSFVVRDSATVANP